MSIFTNGRIAHLGRPQALLNPMVDECDLFVGLLWERWGQPSGQYSSGFEEEYERARARRKAHDKPEIWLVFKQVDPSKLRDPGDQLKKVLEFKRSQTELHEVLFKEVRDADDWKNKFKDWLLEHVLMLPSPVPTAHQQPAGVVPVSDSPDTSAVDSSSQVGDRDAIPQQLRTVSALLGKSLQARVPECFAAHEGQLQEFDVARLYLLTATLMSHRYTRDILTTHDINLLYKYRDRLEPTSFELSQLLRAVVEDSGDVKPGWFWFQRTEEDRLPKILLGLASQDYSGDVRARALTLLAAAQIEIPWKLWPALPLADDSPTVRQSAFTCLVAQGDERALSLLEQLANDDDSALSSAAQDARLQLLTRLDPVKAFSEVIGRGEYISDGERRSLQARISDVDEQILLKATESSWEQIRQMSLEELVRRGSLTVEIARKFTTDPSLAVRATAFQSLAAQGTLPNFETVRKALSDSDEESGPKTGNFLRLLSGLNAKPSPDVDAIIVTYYRTQSTEQLLVAVDWFSLDGPLAYRALALDRFADFSTDLRSDLANGFERIKQESSRRGEKQYGPEQWKRIAASFEQLDEFIKSQFTKAALFGLAKNAQPADAELARPYLAREDSSLRDLAVTVISKVGTPEDASALLEVAKEAYGGVQAEAAAGALKLSTNPLEAARALMVSNNPEVVRVAFGWMFAQQSEDVRKTFDELLHGSNDKNRVRALYYLSKRLQPEELEELLKDYIGKETYYYNVVTWLDRILYAPSPLKNMFIRDLQEEAN
jgi:HEAT repeat protein